MQILRSQVKPSNKHNKQNKQHTTSNTINTTKPKIQLTHILSCQVYLYMIVPVPMWLLMGGFVFADMYFVKPGEGSPA